MQTVSINRKQEATLSHLAMHSNFLRKTKLKCVPAAYCLLSGLSLITSPSYLLFCFSALLAYCLRRYTICHLLASDPFTLAFELNSLHIEPIPFDTLDRSLALRSAIHMGLGYGFA